jgi:hypothetical protein
MRAIRLGAWVMAVGLACAGWTPASPPGEASAPQVPISEGRRDPRLEKWKPAVMPADGLAYGAALEESATENLRRWCREYARTKMSEQPIDPRTTMRAVDAEFPQYSDAVRDAITYLLIYLAYKEENRTQAHLVGEIKRMDDEAHEILLRMQRMRENEMNKLASTRTTATQQEMLRNDEDERRKDQQLRDMALMRRVRMQELERARKRVDGYLKVIQVTYPRMNGVPANILRDPK